MSYAGIAQDLFRIPDTTARFKPDFGPEIISYTIGVVIAHPAWHHHRMAWFIQTGEGLLLNVHATPRAARSEFAGLYGADALRVRLRAPPVDGKANAALLNFLAEAFGLTKRNVTLIQGATGRHKRVLLRGLTSDAVHQVTGL